MNHSEVDKKIEQQAKSIKQNIPSVLKFPNGNGAKQSEQLYNLAFKSIKPDDTCLIVGDTGVVILNTSNVPISGFRYVKLPKNPLKAKVKNSKLI